MTLSASHFPYHFMGMKPLAFSCSWAVEASFFALDGRRPLPSRSESGWRSVGEGSSRPEGCELVALPVPGCLKMPKFLGETS